MKKKYRIKRWVKVVIVIIIVLCTLFGVLNRHTKTKQDKVVQSTKKEKKPVKEQINYELEQVEEPQEEIQEEPIVETYTTRMTSYYPEEGETTTASGLGINNFGINDKGWFTYNNKLVVATASTRLGATNMRTYNLYDEIILTIDGIDYEAVVLDVCGACQRDNRIDLFASSVVYAKDTQVIVKIK